MKSIILHIGYNKTGTTAIQKSLYYNRDILEKNGIYYPKKCRGKRKSPAHHALAESLLFRIKKPLPRFVNTKIYSNYSFDYYWNILKAELQETKAPVVFISSEAFSRLRGNPAQMQFIREQLKGHRIRILVYLRSQPEFLASAYNQAVKRGYETRTVEELMHSGWMTINYFEELEDWASVFGCENIIVRIFDQQKMPGGVMVDVEQVLSNEGIVLIKTKNPKKSFSLKWNVGLPNSMVETKRQINASCSLPAFLDKAVNAWLHRRGKNLPDVEILSKAQKDLIIQRNYQSNQKLGEKYLNGKLPFIE